MGRGRRNLLLSNGGTGGTTTEPPEATTTETSDGSFADLIQEDQFMDERGTITVPKEDVPLGIEGLPIPLPWQGLRRAAIVFNLNFVWDSAEEEWIRDEGNGGGGGGAFSLIDSGTFDVPDSSGPPNSFFSTGVTTFREGAFGTLGFADETDLTSGIVNFTENAQGGATSDVMAWIFGYDPAVSQYFYDIQHEFGQTVTVRWAIVEPNF